MLKLVYTGNGDAVLAVSGRLQADKLDALAALLDARRPHVLDLKDLVRVDEDAVRFLCACERDGITLLNCPSYIRTWVTSERNHS